MGERREEAARLTAISDQTVAAITSPDTFKQNGIMMLQVLHVADLLADAGMRPAQVVGQITGECGALLANWLHRREQAGL